MEELLAGSSAALSSTETVSVRHFVEDFKAGRYNFKLPFQRKPQWKDDARSSWIIALLKKHLTDPLSISKPFVGPKRGVNGGNRARATVDYTENRFPMVVKYGGRNHNFWYTAIPEKHQSSKQHHVLAPAVRDRLLDIPMHLNIRHNLTLDEEVEWYINMNKNQVSHTPGHLLNGHICKEREDPFVIAMLRLFPSIKDKYEISADPADANSLGSMLEAMSEVDIDVMNTDDKRDDCVVSIATLTNLLACGDTYDKDGFGGACNTELLTNNVNQVMKVFHDYVPSEQMLGEFASKVQNKPYQARFWSASYLLGPMFYSIAKKKPNAVQTWRVFLDSCVSGTIDDVYFKELAAMNIGGESNTTRYSKIWDLVVAHLAKPSTA